MKKTTQHYGSSNADDPGNQTGHTHHPTDSRAEVIGAKPAESITDTLLWQEIFDAITDAICILDNDHRIVKCNLAMCRLLKLNQDQILGRHCWQLVHGSNQILKDCPCQRVAISSQRESITLKYGQRWFEVAVDPSFDDQGQVKGYIHVMSDITQSAHKEIVLRETHNTLLTVLDSIDAIIYAADIETNTFIFMNRHMREMVKGDLGDQTCWQILHNRSEPCDRCRDFKLLDEQGKPTELHIHTFYCIR